MKDPIPSTPTDYFSRDQWSELTGGLRLIAEEIAEKATNSIHSNSRWPQVRARRRRLLRVRSVVLGLQPNYLNDKEIFWEISVEEVQHLWPVWYKLIQSSVVKRLSGAELNDPAQVADDFATVSHKYLSLWSGFDDSVGD